MKKRLILVLAVLLIAFTLVSCVNVYKKGVDYDDYPDRDVPIYDDAIVFSYESDRDECTIIYGTKDDVDDVLEFYEDEFEDEDYTILDEDIEDDEFSMEGIVDDIAFEIEAEEAKRDEADYFDTVVEVNITFDVDVEDYEEDSNGYAAENEEEGIAESAQEDTSLSAGTEDAEVESDGTVKYEAMNALIEGETYVSDNGYITVEFGAIDMESGSNNYLHMESVLTITNNSSESLYILINKTWTNGYALGAFDNFIIDAGDTAEIAADFGAFGYRFANINELTDLFFYVTIWDLDYDILDELKVSFTNTESSYIQQDISDAPILAVTSEVTISYGGFYPNEYYDNMIFYIVTNDSTFSQDNEYTVYLDEVVINDIALEDALFYQTVYGGGISAIICTFEKGEFGGVFEAEELVLNSAQVMVMDAVNYSQEYYDVDEMVLE